MICSGDTWRHTRAVAEAIIENLAKEGVRLWHNEGLEGNVWMLLDYGDVVVHLFETQVREFYDLEHLWGDAPVVGLPSISKTRKIKNEGVRRPKKG